MKNTAYRTLVLWVFIILGVSVVWYNADQRLTQKIEERSFPEFIQLVKDGKVTAVTIKGSEWSTETVDGQSIKSVGPEQNELYVQMLEDSGITPDFQPAKDGSLLTLLLFNYVPFIVLILIVFFFMRQLQAGGGKAMSFGKSRAKLLTESTSTITFDDVAGIQESKEELEEIIMFLKTCFHLPSKQLHPKTPFLRPEYSAV